MFCLLEKGDLQWRQDFPLRQVTERLEVVLEAITEIPSSIEAYSCQDPKKTPTAQVRLYEINDCREEQFNNYKKKGIRQATLLHRVRTS